MKKIIIFLLIITFGFNNLKAQQFNLNLLPTAKNVQSISLNKLIHFQLQNLSGESNVYVQLQINNIENGSVTILRSSLTSVSKGVHNSRTILGSLSNVLNVVQSGGGMENILSPSFIFPTGKYTYCVEILNVERLPLIKECDSFISQSNQFLLLIYPFDKEELDEDLPLFNWAAAFPQFNGNVKYKIKWVEADAVYKNKRTNLVGELEFYRQHEVIQNYFSYNLHCPPFDKSKIYYWQVEAYNGNNLIASSPVWEFRFKKDVRSSPEPMTFVKVDFNSNKIVHEFSGENLNFEWDNSFNFQNPTVKIVSMDGTIVFEEEKLDTYLVQTSGSSFFNLDISKVVQANEMYILHILSKNNDYQIKFKKSK